MGVPVGVPVALGILRGLCRSRLLSAALLLLLGGRDGQGEVVTILS